MSNTHSREMKSFKEKSDFYKIAFRGKPLGFENVVSAFAMVLFGLGMSLIMLMAELTLKQLKKIRGDHFGMEQTGAGTPTQLERIRAQNAFEIV